MIGGLTRSTHKYANKRRFENTVYKKQVSRETIISEQPQCTYKILIMVHNYVAQNVFPSVRNYLLISKRYKLISRIGSSRNAINLAFKT